MQPTMGKPSLLYHGSQIYVPVLTPHQAHDGLSDVGTADGVFATPHRELALVFALGGIPDEQGRITRLVQSIDPVRVIFLEGRPNRGGKGYLYTVDSATFHPLDDMQWISHEAVVPLHVEEINVDDYLYIVQAVTDEDRAALLAKFNQEQRRPQEPT